MTTDYTFDGLDKWEKALSQTIEAKFPNEFKQMVIQIAFELQGRVKENTPVKTGWLRDRWDVGNIIKIGDAYSIEVYTNVDYAEPVEYGHRKRGGGDIVKGSHMMEISLEEVGKALPGYLRAWMNDFLNTHDII